MKSFDLQQSFVLLLPDVEKEREWGGERERERERSGIHDGLAR
jgi:hypothetical protein